MNANLYATKSAAFATAMLDWRFYCQAYVAKIIYLSMALSSVLDPARLPVFSKSKGLPILINSRLLPHPLTGTKPHQKFLGKVDFGLRYLAVHTNFRRRDERIADQHSKVRQVGHDRKLLRPFGKSYFPINRKKV